MEAVSRGEYFAAAVMVLRVGFRTSRADNTPPVPHAAALCSHLNYTS